jgi:PHS family inorganic phosphate transporter-like MFS transporter
MCVIGCDSLQQKGGQNSGFCKTQNAITMTEEDGISEAERSVEREMDDDDTSRDDSSTVAVKSWWQKPAQVTAMVSNFSTSYNVVNISLVLPILEDLYEGSSEDAAACASSLLAGMIVGQVVGGALGDSFLGRLGALRLVMAVQIVASIGSAVSLWGDSNNIYIGLAIWRFVLGIGAGAVYPLAATLSAEQAETPSSREELSPEDKVMQLKSVVLTFSMQGFGFLAVPLVAVPLLNLTPESSLDLVWRLLLGFGCLPGLLLIFLQCHLYRSSRPYDVVAIPQSEPDHDDAIGEAILQQRYEPLIPHDEEEDDEEEEFVDETDSDSALETAPGLWASIRKEPNLVGKLLGTAGTWFLFDVLFYGNTLFQPIVMEAAFGGKDTDEDDIIKKAAMDSLFLGLIALPGYAVSALVIGKRFCYILQTPRYVQLQGFVAMAILYATIGVYWSSLKQIPALLVVIYGMTFFFANYGPNTTTFVFPSLVFSRECRSTLNGISAAAGKAGALVGATSFAPAAAAFGDDKVMLICAGVSVVAFALTYCFTRVPATDAHHDHRS